MSGMELTIAGAGAVLVLLALRDVLLALAHLDLEGPIASAVQRAVWRSALALADLAPGLRRDVVASAGPLMFAATLAAWGTCYLVGYALMIWPHLAGGFVDLQGQAPPSTFLNALYFSGTSGTTLGFGDLAPVNGFTRALAVSEAVLGLALMSGVITFLLNGINAVVDRNLATLTIHDEAGAAQDGVSFVIRVLLEEGEGALAMRLATISGTLRAFYVRAHHYAIVHLFYRSCDPAFDPEPAFRVALEAAIAAHLVGNRPDARRIRAEAAHLHRVLERLMRQLAADHLGAKLHDALEGPNPDPADHALVAAIRARLACELPPGAGRGGDEAAALALACQGRRFLDALEVATRWRRDHPRPAGLVGLP